MTRPAREMPRDKAIDSTLAFLCDPYRFISERCQRYGSDLFETRILLQRTICVKGAAAARAFYESGRLERKGAMPAAIRKTLLGEGGVQSLDGDAHVHRKRMLMSLMAPQRIEDLLRRTEAEWRTSSRKWAAMREVVFYREVQELLTRAASSWAGAPLPEAEVMTRTREIAALFDYAGSVSLRHFQSRRARKSADRWAVRLMTRIRSGDWRPPGDSAAHVIAWHRDLQGELLPAQTAAVEFLNIIRPIVAVSVYVAFIAHALHFRPELKELVSSNQNCADLFVQEVRRFYPFFPAVAARVREEFQWKGFWFPAGARVLLDLYGTNRDPSAWRRPQEFDLDHIRQWDGDAFSLIPQGGGDHYAHHRCAGEWITLALMNQATDMLAARLSYEAPQQDFGLAWSRLPAIPKSGFVIRNVRAIA